MAKQSELQRKIEHARAEMNRWAALLAFLQEDAPAEKPKRTRKVKAKPAAETGF